MDDLLSKKQRNIVSLETLLESNRKFLLQIKRDLEKVLKNDNSDKNSGVQKLINKIAKREKYEYDYDLLIVHFEEVHPDFYKHILAKTPL